MVALIASLLYSIHHVDSSIISLDCECPELWPPYVDIFIQAGCTERKPVRGQHRYQQQWHFKQHQQQQQHDNSNSNGGILCVLVSTGRAPRLAIYGEGHYGQHDMRILGQAAPIPVSTAQGQDSQNLADSNATNSTSGQADNLSGATAQSVSIGGFQVESTLKAVIVRTVINRPNNQVKSINENATITVFPDHMELLTNQGKQMSFFLQSDIPNYTPLKIPTQCGPGLDAYHVHYTGTKISNQHGIRCAMPHASKRIYTFFGAGELGGKPYMYLATRGADNKWGRVGICWFNQGLQGEKCPKGDWGSFTIQDVDVSKGKEGIQSKVANGLRELWHSTVSKGNSNESTTHQPSSSNGTSQANNQSGGQATNASNVASNDTSSSSSMPS